MLLDYMAIEELFQFQFLLAVTCHFQFFLRFLSLQSFYFLFLYLHIYLYIHYFSLTFYLLSFLWFIHIFTNDKHFLGYTWLIHSYPNMFVYTPNSQFEEANGMPESTLLALIVGKACECKILAVYFSKVEIVERHMRRIL